MSADCVRTVDLRTQWSAIAWPDPVACLLRSAPGVLFPCTREELLTVAMGGAVRERFDVCYEVLGRGLVREVAVTRCRNALVVNYDEPAMRRRDPDCMVVADTLQTDKARYHDRFGEPFDAVRAQTLEWLKSQRLIVMPFSLGAFSRQSGQGAVLVAPENAGFFAGGLADLQGMIGAHEVPAHFQVRSVIYLAPPFRHTHFGGRQLVVHHRDRGLHEVFSYNLYPGPSAKKGVYGVLLSMGEARDWPTLHASTVQVVTPYDNVTTIMHEGASGGGKSEMLEFVHRQADGRLCVGRNTITGEQRLITLNQACDLRPVTDDMAMCRPNAQNTDGDLVVQDAEQAWFLRVNHIRRYGTDPHMEALTIHPPEPLIMFNLHAAQGGTCLIWDHIEDAPGQPCPNPRVILPRRHVPNVVDGPVRVMLRSFGVRTPPCTREQPTYGILGFLHLLPAALAWLWRLVAPRGHANPSIVGDQGMSSEGVGSYWPFAAGRIVDHANLLLRQIQTTPKVRYTVSPNQHVGAWEVSFMPQWISREYLARRGVAPFRADQVLAARCPLLGYTLKNMQVEGAFIPHWFLRTELQPEVGPEGYDSGARLLEEFFHRELRTFLHADLDPLGRRIIECCLDGGQVEDYATLLYDAVEPDSSRQLHVDW